MFGKVLSDSLATWAIKEQEASLKFQVSSASIVSGVEQLQQATVNRVYELRGRNVVAEVAPPKKAAKRNHGQDGAQAVPSCTTAVLGEPKAAAVAGPAPQTEVVVPAIASPVNAETAVVPAPVNADTAVVTTATEVRGKRKQNSRGAGQNSKRTKAPQAAEQAADAHAAEAGAAAELGTAAEAHAVPPEQRADAQDEPQPESLPDKQVAPPAVEQAQQQPPAPPRRGRGRPRKEAVPAAPPAPEAPEALPAPAAALEAAPAAFHAAETQPAVQPPSPRITRAQRGRQPKAAPLAQEPAAAGTRPNSRAKRNMLDAGLASPGMHQKAKSKAATVAAAPAAAAPKSPIRADAGTACTAKDASQPPLPESVASPRQTGGAPSAQGHTGGGTSAAAPTLFPAPHRSPAAQPRQPSQVHARPSASPRLAPRSPTKAQVQSPMAAKASSPLSAHQRAAVRAGSAAAAGDAFAFGGASVPQQSPDISHFQPGSQQGAPGSGEGPSCTTAGRLHSDAPLDASGPSTHQMQQASTCNGFGSAIKSLVGSDDVAAEEQRQASTPFGQPQHHVVAPDGAAPVGDVVGDGVEAPDTATVAGADAQAAPEAAEVALAPAAATAASPSAASPGAVHPGDNEVVEQEQHEQQACWERSPSFAPPQQPSLAADGRPGPCISTAAAPAADAGEPVPTDTACALPQADVDREARASAGRSNASADTQFEAVAADDQPCGEPAAGAEQVDEGAEAAPAQHGDGAEASPRGGASVQSSVGAETADSESVEPVAEVQAAGPTAPMANGSCAAATNCEEQAGAAAVEGPSGAAAAPVRAKGGNLVSAVRSFLPAKKPPSPPVAAGKKLVKVRALEMAQAAKKQEEARAAERSRMLAERQKPAAQAAEPAGQSAAGPSSSTQAVAAAAARPLGSTLTAKSQELAADDDGPTSKATVGLAPAASLPVPEALPGVSRGAPPGAPPAAPGSVKAKAAFFQTMLSANQDGGIKRTAMDPTGAALRRLPPAVPTSSAQQQQQAGAEAQEPGSARAPAPSQTAGLSSSSGAAAATAVAAAVGSSTATAPVLPSAVAPRPAGESALDKHRRAEAKRREGEEKRRVELEAKAKARDDKVRSHEAAKLQRQQAPAPGAAAAPPSVPGTALRPPLGPPAGNGTTAQASRKPPAGAPVATTPAHKRLPAPAGPQRILTGPAKPEQEPQACGAEQQPPSAASTPMPVATAAKTSAMPGTAVAAPPAPAALPTAALSATPLRLLASPAVQMQVKLLPAVHPTPSAAPAAGAKPGVPTAAANRPAAKPLAGASAANAAAARLPGPGAAGADAIKTTASQQQQAQGQGQAPRSGSSDLTEAEKRNVQEIQASPYVAQVKPRTPAVAGKPLASGHKPQQYTSYDISPYRSDSSDEDDDEDDGRPRKPIPQWAHSSLLLDYLVNQRRVDPDNIFGTCPDTINLLDVFAGMPPPPKTDARGRPRRDYSRRGSSGNWSKDELQAEEIRQYRIAFKYR